MAKDFDSWNKQKKQIELRPNKSFYNSREIWWCALGVNVGFEIDGDGLEYNRPVLIVKGLGPRTCLIVPLTRAAHKHKYRVPIGTVDGFFSTAIISQLRVVDTRRFINKICRINNTKFEEIRKAIRGLL